MSSKASVSQIEINERRLKGVFDQIEAFNYKKAIAEADKVLKKDPNLLAAKVLKALSFYKQNKSVDAFLMIEGVVNDIPTDEQTLNALAFFYRESNQMNKIINAYEEAFKKCPTREDLCANLFYCNVRLMSFNAQQKVAMQLRKLNPKHMEYPMWPIVSNVLSGVFSNDNRLIKLGEAMLSKLFKGDNILSMERVRFLIYTLEKLKKTEEALNWLNGDTLRDVVNDSQNELTALKFKSDLLQKLNRKEECLDIYWKCITSRPHDLGTWKEYIDLCVDLNVSGQHSVDGVVKKISEINTNVELLHLHTKLSLEKQGNDSCLLLPETKVTYLLKYLDKFMGKSHIIYDVYKFLEMPQFTDNERNQFLDAVLAKWPNLKATQIKDISCAETFYLRETLTRAITGECTSAQQLKLMYDHIKTENNDKVVSPTEIRFYDNIGRLAVSEMYRTRSSSKDMLDAILLAHGCHNNSPANHFIGLQLVHMLSEVGCLKLVMELGKEMHVKQTLWDSVGYLFMFPWLQCPNYTSRNKIWSVNKNRLEKNKREIEDSFVTAYKLGNYGVIPEFIDFHGELSNNVMAKLTETEMMFTNVVIVPNLLDELFEALGAVNNGYVESKDTDLNIDRLFDNVQDKRDLDVVPDFPKISKEWIENDRNESYNELIEWIKLRTNTVRFLYSGARLTMETVVKLDKALDTSSNDQHDTSTQQPNDYYHVIASIHEYYSAAVHKLLADSSSRARYPTLSRVLPGCVGAPLSQRSLSVLLYTCGTLMHVYQDLVIRHKDTTANQNNSNSLAELRRVVTEIVDDCASAFINKSQDSPLDLNAAMTTWVATVPAILAHLTQLIDCVSLASLLLCMLDNILMPLRPKPTPNKKRNKKRKPINEAGENNENTSNDMDQSKLSQLKYFHENYAVRGLLEYLEQSVEANLNNIDVCLNQLTNQNLLSQELSNENLEFLKSMTNSWVDSFEEASNLLLKKRILIGQLRKRIDQDSVILLEFDKLSTEEITNGI